MIGVLYSNDTTIYCGYRDATSSGIYQCKPGRRIRVSDGREVRYVTAREIESALHDQESPLYRWLYDEIIPAMDEAGNVVKIPGS